jgi:diaminopimelate decarboxylase
MATRNNPKRRIRVQAVTTRLSDERLVELADKYNTPLYVFEESVIRDRCRELKAAITYPHAHIRYACKALTLQKVLQVIKDEGLWIDASSRNEVERALRAGFLPEEIYYTGEGADLSVYQFLVKEGILINCTSIDQIRLLGAVPRRIETVCSIRVNPGEGDGATNETNTGGPSSKHGIYLDQIEEAKAVARSFGIKIVGIHSHIGSGGASIKPWLRIKDKTLRIAKGFENLRFVNLGGGLPVVYDEKHDTPMEVKKWGEELSKGMAAFSKALGRTIQLQVEPGRFIVAHSGTLLATVQATKSTPSYNFAIVNTGLNHNPRPAMYGSFHPIRFVSRTSAAPRRRRKYVIAGYLCESGDVFTREKSGLLKPRTFPHISVGDLMVMGCVGAYSHPMKSDYNSMNMPMSLLIEQSGRDLVIERRGTLADIMRREMEAFMRGR